MTPTPNAVRRTRVAGAAVGLLLLALVAGCGGGTPASSGSPSASGTPSSSAPTSAPTSATSPTAGHPTGGHNPVLAKDGGVHNVTFYYQGTQPLEPGADLAGLGSPSVVVTTPKANEQNAIASIHALGAKAYRYIQFYWAPNDAAYEGINLANHPDWAFCGQGNKPLVGRTTGKPGHRQTWNFIDANEKPVRAALSSILDNLKAEGWDGVMFDRGGAALQNATDAAGRPVWDKASTCTQQPYEKGARFADAYVNTLGLAHQAGLKVLLNYGISPFDGKAPLRPDPANPACQRHHWSSCSFLDDVWKNIDLVLNESVAFPKDSHWQDTFDANQRSEQDVSHGRRTVGLITTYTLGGARHQNRADVYYEWARTKLFDMAVAVNTGDGGCAHSRSGVCNRYGMYPELVDTHFGAPLQAAPTSTGCDGSSTIHCVWTRTYAQATDVVNASARARHGFTLDVGNGSCQHVFDVFAQKPLAGNRCVQQVTLDLPPWSGRPLLLSSKAFG